MIGGRERTAWISAVVVLLAVTVAAVWLAVESRKRSKGLEHALEESIDTADMHYRTAVRESGHVHQLCVTVERELGVDVHEDPRFRWCHQAPCGMGWLAE